jgi:hypothetical protein
MRKRIPCKVVRSVTLGKSDDRCRHVSGSSVYHSGAPDIASLTYTSRMVVTKSDIDDDYSASTLDLCA